MKLAASLVAAGSDEPSGVSFEKRNLTTELTTKRVVQGIGPMVLKVGEDGVGEP